MAKKISGKRSGATMHEDGSISISPMYADEISAIQDRVSALATIQEQTLAFLADQQRLLAADRRRFWHRLGDDLSLDYNEADYSYDPVTRRLIKRARAIKAAEVGDDG